MSISKVKQRQRNIAKLFSAMRGKRTMGNGQNRKFCATVHKNIFMVRVTELLPREVVESPCLETFKTRLDAYLCNLV